MLDISKKIPKGYFQTEFDLVNATNFPVSFNLFDVNTLSVTPTQASPILPPSVFGSSISIGEGADPQAMAYNPTNNTIYVCNNGNDTVSIINCNTNTIIATISVPSSSPSTIAYNPISNTMYFTGNLSGLVYVIDCATNLVIGSPISVGTDPTTIAYCSLNNTMYVVNNGSNDVSVIDCNTNTVIGLPITIGNNAAGISYDSLDNRMYVCNAFDDTVSVINCTTNLVISTIPVGVFPLDIAYNSLSNTVYVACSGSTAVYVIDCSTNTVIGSPIVVGLSCTAIVYNSILNLMYTSSISSVSIYVIDCSSNVVVNTIATPSQISALGLVFNVNDNTIFSSYFNTDSISVLSPLSQTTTYIGGSFNYNQFIQDIQDNPVSIKDVMFYSSDPNNINQVFFTQFKDADGKASYLPQYPQLSVGVNQFQGSVSKVDFGENGVLLDSNNSFYDVTVQGNSSLKLVLIMKQMKKAYSLDAPDISEKMDLIKNNVQYILGVDGRNNIERFSVFNLGENEK
jgi:YVTN family beta-propeller protein